MGELEGSRRLMYLLWRFRAAAATNKQDKVYGLLGLCDNDMTQRLGVDYIISWQEVFQKTTAFLIDELQDMRILVSSAGSNTDGIPTWVSDWSQEIMNYCFDRTDRAASGLESHDVQMQGHLRFNAQESDSITLPLRSFSIQCSKLRIQAYLVGWVAESSDREDMSSSWTPEWLVMQCVYTLMSLQACHSKSLGRYDRRYAVT